MKAKIEPATKALIFFEYQVLDLGEILFERRNLFWTGAIVYQKNIGSRKETKHTLRTAGCPSGVIITEDKAIHIGETESDTEQTKPLLILPAAGLGRRVGSPPAKELLLGPDGQPLIDWWLDLSESLEWPTLVIIRHAKVALQKHLQARQLRRQDCGKSKLTIALIEPSKEWAETPLRAKAYWRQRNILAFPDSRFSPVGAIVALNDELAQNSGCFATFAVDDGRQWGLINCNPAQQRLLICDKPTEPSGKVGDLAFGLLGFREDMGVVLLEALLDSHFDHQWREVRGKFSQVPLESYVDLTR